MSFSRFFLAKGLPLFVVLFLSSPMLRAGDSQSTLTPQIDRQASEFVRNEVQAFLQTLPDARYQLFVRPATKALSACNVPLILSRLGNGRPPVGSVRVNVECPGTWRSYRLVEVDVWVPVVFSIGHLARGQRLGRSDLKKVETPWHKLRGNYLTEFEPLLGRQLKRSVKAGKLLDINFLAPEYLVSKGDSVTIQAGEKGLQVSVAGVAMESGEFEESIRVRNRSSGKVIDARVIGRGKVQALF
ncbi:MAG: flagellar basal body P-ring formation chaperone FlgA [Endozoicomonas sp.]